MHQQRQPNTHPADTSVDSEIDYYQSPCDNFDHYQDPPDYVNSLQTQHGTYVCPLIVLRGYSLYCMVEKGCSTQDVRNLRFVFVAFTKMNGSLLHCCSKCSAANDRSVTIDLLWDPAKLCSLDQEQKNGIIDELKLQCTTPCYHVNALDKVHDCCACSCCCSTLSPQV